MVDSLNYFYKWIKLYYLVAYIILKENKIIKSIIINNIIKSTNIPI